MRLDDLTTQINAALRLMAAYAQHDVQVRELVFTAKIQEIQRSWQAALQIMEDERAHAKAKDEQQEARITELIAERERANRARTTAHKERDSLRQLLETRTDERDILNGECLEKEHEIRRLTALLENPDPPATPDFIADTAECPVCSLRNIVAIGGALHECPGCRHMFELDIDLVPSGRMP